MSYATLLFANPSFLDGFGRCLDLAGVSAEFNSSLTPAQADALALRSDWFAVGADLWSAVNEEQLQLPSQNDESKKEAKAK